MIVLVIGLTSYKLSVDSCLLIILVYHKHLKSSIFLLVYCLGRILW